MCYRHVERMEGAYVRKKMYCRTIKTLLLQTQGEEEREAMQIKKRYIIYILNIQKKIHLVTVNRTLRGSFYDRCMRYKKFKIVCVLQIFKSLDIFESLSKTSKQTFLNLRVVTPAQHSRPVSQARNLHTLPYLYQYFYRHWLIFVKLFYAVVIIYVSTRLIRIQ